MLRALVLHLLLPGTLLLAAGEAEDQALPPAFTRMATEVAEAIEGGKPQVADACWDLERFGDRTLAGLRLEAAQRRDFIAGMSSTFKWGTMNAKQLGDGGSYRLVRTSRQDGIPHALYRMVNSEGALNYHHLSFSSDGADAKAVDAYIHTSGELLSETMRVMIAPAFAKEKGVSLGKLLGLPDDDPLTGFARLHQLIEQGDHRGALAAYAALPKATRALKGILLQRLRAAQQVGDREYRLALKELAAAFPRDPATSFMLIDAHFMDKELEPGLACIDRLEQALGGDPYLDTQRAALLMETGHLPEARLKAEAAVRNEPVVKYSWWTLVTVTLRQRDHRRTAELLTAMKERFALTFGDLAEIPDYKQFVASPEYAAWLKQQTAPASAPAAAPLSGAVP